MQIIKATGEKEEFSRDKLTASIARAGIPKDLREQVAAHVESKLSENIPTSEIYHHITEFLEQSDHPYEKAKYGLKQSIMALGPTGYPFEDYVAEVLKSQGYQTAVRQLLKGRCVTHEVDVVAKKDNEAVMVEAKFHNNPGIHTQVHVSLYTKARFDDLKDIHHFSSGWLVTNTKATPDAIAYAACAGIKIISWSYPQEGSLREIIETADLHPITALTTLSDAQKQQLLNAHIVLCKTISQNPAELDILALPADKKQKVLDEAAFLYKDPLE
ncbi:MAG TPA: restriction endonuclease [Candidatus Saccharimonadales bacterium]|nr:restriction endonuclease [Candidatus Saccharimonadales bacterium]